MPIAKSTGKAPRKLAIGHREIEIPANTMVIPSHIAVHTHPRYWGTDSLEWRPSRWITRSDEGLENENIMVPTRGTFIAWSEGIRNCPGKRFSQVEFVAAMVKLFREWVVEPIQEPSESIENARQRVMETVENKTGQVLLLQMLHPEKAGLVWRRRQ